MRTFISLLDYLHQGAHIGAREANWPFLPLSIGVKEK